MRLSRELVEMPDYQLIRRLGAGQFGEVWLVLDRAFDLERAVKFVRPDRIHDPSNFYSEPQALVALRHENIVDVFDAGTLPDGRLYIAMEYLERGSIEDEFAGGVVDVVTALRLVADACRGAEFSHMNDYVHRDIKPANIMLADNGQAKLSDFGLATRVGPNQTASPYGYIAHCAPEVLSGGDTSARTDVYALGVTLYRLLNGDAYLPDPTTISGDLDDAIITGDFPDRSKFREHVPETVRRLVRSAIHVDPANRTSSAAALRHVLERAQPLVSFTEETTSDIAYWVGQDDRRVWEAEIWKEEDGSVTFQVQRAVGAGKPRRVRDDCLTFQTEKEARRHARTVLDRISRLGR